MLLVCVDDYETDLNLYIFQVTLTHISKNTVTQQRSTSINNSQAPMNLFFFYLPDRAHCFVKVLARNLAKNIVKERCWTSSLQPLYVVLMMSFLSICIRFHFNISSISDLTFHFYHFVTDPTWRCSLFKMDTLNVEVVENRPLISKNVDDARWQKSDPFSTFLLTQMRSSIIWEWPQGYKYINNDFQGRCPNQI